MDHLIKTMPVKKERFKIGFLDDNQNNDFHIQIMMGIVEAAKEFNVDIIRFSYYSSHIAYKFTHQVDMVLDHIEQYELDGLMFLGWTKAGAMYNYANFLTRFDSLPILSIGSNYEDIPNVYFAGDEYIREIVLHLIVVHKLTQIAFIEHHRTDQRKDAYVNTMQQYNIYNPLLYISDLDLKGLDIEERNKRAVEILFDERKVKVEAVITLNVTETGYLMVELNRRGIKVPGDVAVTSYEDGESARYSSPGYTTIYFPWKELGYYACRNMVQLLKEGQLTLTTSLTGVGRIIYRESCGCMPYTIKAAEINNIYYASHGLDQMTKDETDIIINSLESLYYNTGIHFDKLVNAFTSSNKNKNNLIFLSELLLQLRDAYGNKSIEDLVSNIRKLFFPYLLKEVKTLQWAGDLFQQAQVLVSERLAGIFGTKVVEAKLVDQNLQVVSQTLLMNFNLQNLVESLERGLPKLNIPSCHIFISNSIFNEMDVEENLFEKSVLVFKYISGNVMKTPSSAGSLKQQLSDILLESKENVFLAYLLHVTDEIMGFALFEPGPMDETVYQTLSTHISTALRGIVLMNRLNITYKKLVEHAQREGMADIAADILHNIGNIMNSISVSVHLMEESAKMTVTDDLIMAGRLLLNNMDNLENFICNDPKGKKLMQFYIKLGAAASRLQSQLHYNISRLQDKVGAINKAIAAQQNYAGIDMKLELLYIEPILEDALKVNQATFEKYEIKIERNYAISFKAHVHRAKLFYIIINIITNAKDAMSNVAGICRTLTVSMYEDSAGKYLQINDNGVGISDGILDKIFEHGFTTKANRYGYGLYSCASYMADMGGSIRAESEGEGKGAAFILSFP